LREGSFRLITLGRIALVSPEGAEDATLATRRLKVALLAVLALASHPLSRDYLVGMFWGDQDEERARHSLSDALSHLRKVLGREAISVRQTQVALSDEARLTVDAVEFDRAVVAREYERATALYGGPFLESVYVAGSRSFEEWADAERARLDALFVKSSSRHARGIA
jgi:DNA-binding SARP family transcriptional activator